MLGIDAVRARRAAAAAQDVRANDEIPVRVDRFARPDGNIPPAGVVLGVVPGDVRIAGQGVADQHRVVAAALSCAVGFIGHGHAGQRRPAPASAARRKRRFAGGAGAASADTIAAGKGVVGGHGCFGKQSQLAWPVAIRANLYCCARAPCGQGRGRSGRSRPQPQVESPVGFVRARRRNLPPGARG